MAFLEVVQAISGILADIGEITSQGMNIYLLARRIEEKEEAEEEKEKAEEEKENPPE